MIVEPTKSAYPNHNKDLFQKFIDRGVPILYIHAAYPNIPGSSLVEDDIEAGYLATKHLVELGHRRIGGLFKNDDLQGHGRYAGMIKCLREYECPIDEEAIVWFGTEDMKRLFNDHHAEELLGAWRDVTGLVCYNDQIAMGVMSMAKTRQLRIPGDYSLVSFDNSNLAQNAEAGLTTIAHPKELLGRKAADMILTLLQKKPQLIQEVMRPELIVRDSAQAID